MLIDYSKQYHSQILTKNMGIGIESGFQFYIGKRVIVDFVRGAAYCFMIAKEISGVDGYYVNSAQAFGTVRYAINIGIKI
jgi:hypothetical protein